MSFPTDFDDDSYSTGPFFCNGCFDAGKTPLKLYVTFVGILFGQATPGVDPPPPNKTLEFALVADCRWTAADAGSTFILLRNQPFSLLVASGIFPLEIFIDNPAASCANNFVNDKTDPLTDDYYNGTAVITSPAPGGEDLVPDVMADVGIEQNAETFCEPLPVDAVVTILRFARRFDATNILIKHDSS